MDWDSVVEDLGPRLFRYFRASASISVAEDLVQHTLLRLVEKVEEGRFNPLLGNLRMFAFGIAHYVRLEHARTIPPGSIDLDDVEIESAGAAPDGALEVRRLRRAITQLTPEQRSVITLMIDRDLTLTEISVILCVPENTVKSHVHRAKVTLRNLLQKE